MRKDSKSTIKDVAQACGVSLMTVSYVINERPGKVSAATRARVLTAARELDYRPNAIARGLARRRMDSIGVVFYTRSTTPLVKTAYFGDILGGILESSMEAHQSTTLFTEVNCADARENVNTYCDGRCDGLLFIAPPFSDTLAELLNRKHIPYVFLGDQPADTSVSCVDVDNVGSAREAVRFLLEKGHRRIAFLGGDAQITSSRLREEGYRQALSQASIPLDDALVLPGLYSQESGRQRALELRERSEELPTALFCANDDIAIGALTALTSLGVQVPGDVSILGFDDSSAASVSQPALTTMRQPFEQLGRCAVELLLAQIQTKEPAGKRVLLPTSLIVRDSVAAPHSSLSSTRSSCLQKGLHP